MSGLHPLPAADGPFPADPAPLGAVPGRRRRHPSARSRTDAVDPWEAEFPRDVWDARKLGITARGRSRIRFDSITRPWLKDLAKRWARWRLSTGLTVESAALGTAAIDSFNAFLDSTRAPVKGTADIDRALIEQFLAYLHARSAGPVSHRTRVGQFNLFLLTMRRHGWVTDLPNTALIYTEDYPKETVRAPRALSEHVMAQLEAPENLDKWPNPHHRLITLILMRCGLRISDAVALAHDCIVRDRDGAPYLRYLNHKMKREALVPIDEELERAIADHLAHLRQGTGTSPRMLFPSQGPNAEGTGHISTATYRTSLRRWASRCRITDENGNPATVSPHRFRHTLGTRLINLDVPQEVVRRILDHDSHQMTAHYARLSDTSIRRHWEAARKVNASGAEVTLDPDGPLADAAWSKQRLGRVTQALSNGYCGLPVQKTCPHANACLTCPMFVTTAEFLPQHREHRTQVVQIISAAEARGQQRLVEMNTRVLGNLDRIIGALSGNSTPAPGPDEGRP
ncbi:tyrosine-type recombinase/integrase [Sinomonas atrocyanea]|uniref:tyrosine-type recombinase/integrase n=1 Tax=Sinomonas atrocyanea TaxID=37927 RepID=UPI002856FE69|nr:tyrosine-type recombinase/integrase [Sinomonas atrocyanea]MDR6623695.1 integrase [Sinomonas atrocyanea]